MAVKYIYKYDPDTFEYLETQTAYIDPEETKVQGKNVYCLPAWATFTKPPKTSKNEIAVFDSVSDDWIIEADYRGMYQVSENMQPEEIFNIGDVPEGYIAITEAQANKIIEDPFYYIVDKGELVINPDYAEQKQAKEQTRISHLKCTKRVFVLMLEQLGFDYFEQIEPLINANRQAKLEWELCIELERANPLLDLMGEQLNVTPGQIDNLFKYANGEIEESEFLNVH